MLAEKTVAGNLEKMPYGIARVAIFPMFLHPEIKVNIEG
jgi:hypothetical protein